MRKSSLTLSLFFLANVLLAQNNFKIGAFTGYFSWSAYDPITKRPTSTAAIIPDKADDNGNKTSTLNVMSEDGFNLFQTYWPDPWMLKTNFKPLVQLAQNNGMQTMDYYGAWFKPTQASPSHTGIYQFNAQPIDQTRIGWNYDWLYQNILNDPTISSNFYMHNLGGEFNCFHYYPVANWAEDWCDHAWADCYTHQINPSTTCDVNHRASEVPPQILSDAFNYLRITYPSVTHPIGSSLVLHDNYVTDTYVDWCTNVAPFNGQYHPQDYINFLGVSNLQRPAIVQEESYYTNGCQAWPNDAYMGKFKNIDYIRSKGYLRIISENDIAKETSGSIYQLHSNPNIQNANFLRFLSYTSIIHGIEGITFYTMDGSSAYYVSDWSTSPPTMTFDPQYDPDGQDQTRYNNWNNPSLVTRYNRTNFPYVYQTFVSKMTREIRYLANNATIIPNATISSAGTNVLYNKLGNTSVQDPNAIVEASTNYLPSTISHTDLADYNLYNNLPSTTDYLNNPSRGENFGVQYMVTTNSNGDVTMVASNPNPYAIHNVHFDFTTANNTAINNAKAIDVLFEDGLVTDVTATNYKTGNNSSVGIGPTFALQKKYTIPFCNKKFTSDFGPFDVKVFFFNRSQYAGNSSFTGSGWQKKWSNNGDGTIGGWGGVGNLNTTDKFIPIDIDQDGTEELLCVQAVDATGLNTVWAAVKKYNGTTWTDVWNNAGHGAFASTFTGWGIHADDKYIVGDFDGNGKANEILCIRGSWATILQATGTGSYSFNTYWSNNGNGYLNTSGWVWSLTSTDKFQVGDFDGDGKNNEVLRVQKTMGGLWDITKFSGSSWTDYWGGNGHLMANQQWPIDPADEYYVGDYNGLNGRDEVLCLIRGQRAAVLKKTAGSQACTTEWIDQTGTFPGWQVSSTDKVVMGDMDASDLKDEVMFIQNSAASGWATTEDLNSANSAPQWNWSNHNGGYATGTQNYIGDWLVADPCAINPNYVFIKPVAADKRYLLAFKNYQNNTYLISMYKANGNYNYREANTASDQAPPLTSSGFDFKLYPNPNSGSFSIGSDNANEKSITVTDIMGRTVYETKTNETELRIKLSDGAKGIYFVKLVDGEKTGIKKVVIE